MQRLAEWFRTPGAGLLLALGTALVVRTLYLAEARHTPSFDQPLNDAAFHDYWAKGLISGRWAPPAGLADPRIQTTPFFRPPGYPYFLALSYWLLGVGPWAPRIAQAALGLASVALAFFLGLKLYGRLVGFLLAVFMSLYWSFPYFEAELLEPSLLVYLTLLMLLSFASWLEAPRWWKAAGAGLSLGLYALARPNILLFAALLPLWVGGLMIRRPGDRRRLAGLLALVWAAAAATILPAAIRNYLAARDVVLISSNSGVNLLIGNHPGADGLFSEPEEVRPFRSSFGYADLVRQLGERQGRPLSHSDASRYFSRRAYEFMREHPRQTLRLLARKTLLFWGPFEIGNNKEDHFERLHSRVLRALPGQFTLALVLCAAGLALRRRLPVASPGGMERDFLPLALLFVLSIYLSHLPYFIAGRFRVPILPVLLLYAAVAVAALVEMIQSDRRGEAAAWLGGLLALYLLVGANWAGHQPQEANYYYFRGLAFSQSGRHEEALKELARALQRRPAHAPTLQLVTRLLLVTGHAKDAAPMLDLLLQLEPDNVDALYQHAMLLGQEQKLDEAEALLARAAALAPDRADVLGSWAVTLGSLGRYEDAAPRAERALEIGSALPASFREGLAARLEAYRAGRPYPGDDNAP